MPKRIPKQGGFSDEVWNQPRLQKYVNSGLAFGWVGSFERTDKLDKYLEKLLNKKGLGPRAISIWLTSTSGRHALDTPTMKHVKECAHYADTEVVTWEHPNHQGTLASSEEIRKTLTPEQIKLFLAYIG